MKVINKDNIDLLHMLMEMVEQHFSHESSTIIRHSFLSTNERAVETLKEYGLIEHVSGDAYRLLYDNLPTPEDLESAAALSEEKPQ